MSVPEDTKRLRFRELRAADASDILRVFADPYARRFFPRFGDRASVEGWIQRQQKRYRDYGHGFWALERKDDGRFVGDCGLSYKTVEDEEVLEVGYHLLATERGKGYATEAASACLDHGFEPLKAELVASIVVPENEASRKVAQRIHHDYREFLQDGRKLGLYFTKRADWEKGRKAN